MTTGWTRTTNGVVGQRYTTPSNRNMVMTTSAPSLRLAGDLASTFGWELLLRGSFPKSRRDEGLALFVRIQKEVFAGQQLDLMTDDEVERMHDLKTGR